MASGADEAQRPFPMGEREFVLLMASLMALNAFAIDAMLPALPHIGASLGVSNLKQTQFIISSYVIGSAIGSLVIGPLSDRWGRRALVLSCLGCSVLMALICAITPSFPLMLVARFIHGIAASAHSVIAISIVRDRFSGDRMARALSSIMFVLMLAPVLAPSLGQILLTFAGWREIFYTLMLCALSVLTWIGFRLPETLAADRRQSFAPAAIVRSWRLVVTHRLGIGYMIASGCVTGSLLGFLMSAQSILSQVFDASHLFAVAFACIAGTAAIANLLNSRIVERFGARRIAHTALIMGILFGILQICISLWHPHSLPLFLFILSLSISMVGLSGANLSAVAMTPFADMAGLASSFQNFARTAIAVVIGGITGQRFDGTTIPLNEGFLFASALALCCVFWAERWKLFNRQA